MAGLNPTCILGLAVFLSTGTVLANDLFNPGIFTKSAGGAGLTQSRGAETILHNPANLDRSKGHQVYYEVDVTRMDYRYVPMEAGVDEANLNLLVPPAFVGWSWADSTFSAGALVIPDGVGTEMKVDGVPVQQGTVMEVFDTKAIRTGYRFGLGGGARINPWLTIGLAAVYQYQREEIEGSKDDIVEMDAELEGSGMRYHAGARLTPLADLTLGLHYSPAATRESDANILLNESTAPYISQAVVYYPEAWGLGLEYTLGRLGLFAETGLEKHSAGRGKARTGYPGEPLVSDLRDVQHYSVGAWLQILSNQRLTVGYENRRGNRGNGRYEKDTNGFNSITVSGGGQFGDFAAMDRTSWSGGYLVETGGWDLNLLGSYTRATKLVPDDAPGAGGYEYQMYVFGIGGLKEI